MLSEIITPNQPTSLNGIYFHTSGGYFGFYIGVAKRMIELGTRSKYSRIVSASGGAWGSLLLHMFSGDNTKNDISQILLSIDEFTMTVLNSTLEDINTPSSIFALISPIGGLDLTALPDRLEFHLRKYIIDGMGNEEFLRRVKTMEIVVTPISTLRPVIVSNFTSVDDFMSAMFATQFIPVVMGMPRNVVRDQICIDGGFPYTVMGRSLEFLDSETEWFSVRVKAWRQKIDPLFKMDKSDGTKSLMRIYDMDFHKENVKMGYDAAVHIMGDGIEECRVEH
jgi:hypothetical protein